MKPMEHEEDEEGQAAPTQHRERSDVSGRRFVYAWLGACALIGIGFAVGVGVVMLKGGDGVASAVVATTRLDGITKETFDQVIMIFKEQVAKLQPPELRFQREGVVVTRVTESDARRMASRRFLGTGVVVDYRLEFTSEEDAEYSSQKLQDEVETLEKSLKQFERFANLESITHLRVVVEEITKDRRTREAVTPSDRMIFGEHV
mmetsp:Transcript_676/g.1316  ORF Transcript_676/g.1316 Transcript_676/m.1316 type:complete len:204 (+) Transcript_676:193-804(+)|eukprot:CAMPEP_0181297886 /NCGR_PEP_ID=MMETSP1101-20121128/5485_1 /TAXON_ID=46948 /ORGANISM="Rhodomonas abbreviata, Strain Caron Lab Isolate" /LENGTH=203 /DNA_ID=CAMNT_0023402865 /DNA_START=186 /DNA_END=797 /DNA_ORIENTATION=-